jgi:hypothetical protein
VEFYQCRADEIDKINFGKEDVIVINSVIQYFPDEEYLLDVIAKSIHALNGKGILYIGDVRDEDLRETYEKTLDDYLNDNGLHKKTGVILKELFVRRAFFESLKDRFDSILDVSVSNKVGSIQNEMTRYRYDVVIQVGNLFCEV